MIDLHAHFLPGVDDGPASLEEALAMCRLARADGVEAVVVTPHQRHEAWPNLDRAHLQVLFETLRAAAGDDAPRLHLGAELRVDDQLLDDVDRLPGGELLTMAGTRWLLVEFPSTPGGPDARAIVHELAVAGWRPLLAHPERVPWLAADPALVAALADRGACFQLTASSVLGSLGRRAEAWSEAIISAGFAALVASDAHGPDLRPPLLAEAYRHVTRRWDEETARRLFVDNPRAVLEDRDALAAPRA